MVGKTSPSHRKAFWTWSNAADADKAQEGLGRVKKGDEWWQMNPPPHIEIGLARVLLPCRACQGVCLEEVRAGDAPWLEGWLSFCWAVYLTCSRSLPARDRFRTQEKPRGRWCYLPEHHLHCLLWCLGNLGPGNGCFLFTFGNGGLVLIMIVSPV